MKAEIALTPQHRRIAAIALTLVPVVSVLILIAPAVLSYLDHSEHISVLKRDLLAYQAAIAVMPTEKAALARLKQSPELDEIVIAAPQASVAVAELQERISQVASSAGARVIQSASQVMAPDGALTELGTHIVIEADIAVVNRFLHELEAARPLLMVRRCVIRDPDGEWQDPASRPRGPNVLQAELDISGFMRPS